MIGHTGKLLAFAAILAVATIVAFLLWKAHHPARESGVFEQTFESQKSYADPFNEVDVDVIFSKDGENWRVPTFWRGGSKWTVRFAAPTTGQYTYQSSAELLATMELQHVAPSSAVRTVCQEIDLRRTAPDESLRRRPGSINGMAIRRVGFEAKSIIDGTGQMASGVKPLPHILPAPC
jgi:hypothetical protein